MIEYEELQTIVNDIIINEPEVVAQLINQDPHIMNYLIGKVMRKTRGQADPEVALHMITERI